MLETTNVPYISLFIILLDNNYFEYILLYQGNGISSIKSSVW